jgi:hypothetical protein
MHSETTHIRDLNEFIIRSAKLRMLWHFNNTILGLAAFLFEKGYPVSVQKRWMSHRMATGKGPYDTPIIAIVWKRDSGIGDLVMDLRGNEGWDAIFEYRKNDLLKISHNATRDHRLKAKCENISGKNVYLLKETNPGVYLSYEKIIAVEHKIQAFLLRRTTHSITPTRSMRPRI